MKIVLAGGSGQIGAILKRAFAGDEVVVLSRSGDVRWDGRTLGPWTASLEGAAALINLAGRTVDCRYYAANRRAIMDSRLESTFVLREAIERAAVPPKVWLQSSTATIYADTYGAANDEHGVLGGDEPDLPDTWRFSTDAAGVPVGLPATKWMLELGAFFLRTETELVLKSRRVVPGRLLAEGFTFRHPEWPEAARELVARRRSTPPR